MENSQISQVKFDQPKDSKNAKNVSGFLSNLFKDFKISNIPGQIKQSIETLRQDIKAEFTREEMGRSIDQLKTNVNLGLSQISQSLTGSQIVEYNEINNSGNKSPTQSLKNISVISSQSTEEKDINANKLDEQQFELQMEILQAPFGDNMQLSEIVQFKTIEVVNDDDDEEIWIQEEPEENNPDNNETNQLPN